MGWEGSAGALLVQAPARSRVNTSRLLRAVSGQVLNISKEGDYPAHLVKPFQCQTTLTVEKVFFLCIRRISCISVHAPCLVTIIIFLIRIICIQPLVKLHQFDHACNFL